MTTDKAYRFSSFRLDPQTWKLRKNNEFRPLRPKTFSILRHLLDHAGRLVSKEDLFSAIWPGVNVENSALRVCMNELRQALDDDPHRPRFVETVHRRGYRFIAPVDFTTDDDEEPTQLLQVPAILVGREQESARLLNCWERALTGTRQVVFVVGEPGIGKTTVLDKFLNTPLVSRFALVGHGQCAEQYGKGETYLPVFEALGQIATSRRGKGAREALLRDAPSWTDHLLLIPGALGTDRNGVAGASSTRMLSELNRALNSVAGKRPVVLAFEDLHLSDRATIELIAYLAKRREPARLMIVGTYRNTLPRRDLAQLTTMARDLEAHRQGLTLRLEGLSETEVANYLDHRISGPLPPTLVSQLYRRTGGNPLFLTAIANHLESLGGSTRSWPEDLRELGVPETIQAMIEQQMEEFSEEDRKILKLASVASATGLDFSSAALAAALEDEAPAANQDAFEERCEELTRRANFFRPAGVMQWPDGTIAASYGLGHSVYQEVLYGSLSAGQRARAHLRIARRLEQAYGAESRRIAPELAMHFERGGDHRRAAEHLNHAADNATRRGAPRQALPLIDKAVQLLNAVPRDRDRFIIEVRMEASRSVALSLIGSPPAKLDANTRRIGELVAEGGVWTVQFLLLQGISKLLQRPAETSAAIRMIETALRHAEDSPELASLRNLAHASLAAGFNAQGKFSQAFVQGERAIETYDARSQTPGADSKVVGLSECGIARWFLGFPEHAKKLATEALTFAEHLSHDQAHGFALARAATIFGLDRDLEKSTDLCERLISFASSRDMSRWRAWGLFMKGTIVAEKGELDEGCRAMHSALIELDSRENPQAFAATLHARTLLKMFEVRLGEARPREAVDFIRRTIDECTENEAHGQLSDMYRMMGQVSLAGDNFRREAENSAIGFFQKAIEIAREQGALSLELRAAVDLGDLLRRQGKNEKARAVVAPILAKFTEGHDTANLKAAHTLLAMLEES